MAHPVVDGHVEVLKVVTPGCYWIKCEDCRGAGRIPESIRYKPFSGDFYPSNGTQVFVHDSDGFFYHGTVCGKRIQTFLCKYTVKLTHTFQVKDFERSAIYPIFDEDRTACESAHLISLYRVLPSFPPPEFGSLREFTKADKCHSFEDNARHWDKSNSIVEDVIQSRRKFRYEQEAVINGSLYGKLSFFEATRYINIKDYLASQNVVVRQTYHFEITVHTLMSRPLCKCFNLLPVFNPFDTEGSGNLENSVEKEQRYDLSKFCVHEEDKPLHESLWTPKSINILFTGLNKPSEKEIAIRYIAPDGKVVLGTVLTPNVAIWEQCGIDRPENLLRKYVREKSFFSSDCGPYEIITYDEMPPSSDEEDTSSNDGGNMNLLMYDFEEVLKDFREKGGILVDHQPLSSISRSSRGLLRILHNSFDELGITMLDDWQRVCFPSLLSKLNVLIIGPESHKKITSSILSTLSLMKTSENSTTKSTSSSPIFVVFVHNSKRASHAAELCHILSNFKIISSAYTQISGTQKQEALEGCDVLITTPSNWLTFTKELKCFDYSRLTHAVFDTFEALHKDYSLEIETIFQDLESVREAQTIFLANVWSPTLVTFIPLVRRTTTRCVIDILQACFCYRLEPTVAIDSTDSDDLLVSIIQESEVITMRLLLCHDYHEVASIKSRTHHLASVLYADENEDRRRALECINQWKTNDKTFLVTSDLLFNDIDFTHKANLLVSWKQKTYNRSTLLQRFMSIKAHHPREWRQVPVYIFCDYDNLEELHFIKKLMENVNKPVFLGKDLNTCIEFASKERERRKEGDNHCHSLSMFGKCDSTPFCPYRHTFRQQDLVHVVQNKVFLKITMLKCHNAFHSRVRVEDVISNQETSDDVINSFTSNLSKIQKGLERAFRNRTILNPEEIYDNDIVGACIGGSNKTVLRRVRILSIREKIDSEASEYEVMPIDFQEPSEFLSSTDLFPLPTEVVSFPNDIVDIFLTKLIPTDFKSNWEFETKYLVENVADLMSTNTSSSQYELIAGVVEVVVGRSILVDSLHWGRKENRDMYVLEGSVKQLMLTSNCVKVNPEHLKMLSELVEDCGKQPLIHNSEDFKDLPGGFAGGVVSAYDDPGLFYVQLDSEKSNLFEFENRLNESMNKRRRILSVVRENELCCVLIDGSWNRALILDKYTTRINGDINQSTEATILCVDYGDSHVSVNVNELFCLPDEFVDYPYFALECELVGILPYDGQWKDDVVQEFVQYIRESDLMTPINVKICKVENSNAEDKCLRYQVALRGLDAAELTINEELVKRGLAIWNEATVDLLGPRQKPSHNFGRRRKKD